MTYKTHLSTGLLFSSIVFLLIYDVRMTPVLLLSLIIATVLGSSTPDLDTGTGGLWRKIPAGNIIGKMVKPAFIGGHRHLSHSFIGFGIFLGLFYSIVSNIPLIHNSYFIILAYALGYISHLFADMFTESGVPLLFPWDYHFGIPPIEKVRIKTGHWFENLIIYPLVNILLILAVFKYMR